MAVRVISRAHARTPLQAATLPPAVLAVALAAPALDLLMMVQPSQPVAFAGLLANGVAVAMLLVAWVRFPRSNWLFAAALATGASLVMRMVGADVAPFLTLLSIVALGVGGAFATTEVSLEAA
jgi:hypothetical protein